GGIDLPVMYELLTELFLSRCIRLPVEIEDLLGWPDELFRVAMAVQAESHAQRLRMPDLVHLVNLAVAMIATDPAIHVHGMIEIDIIGSLVNLDPRDGLARVE